MEREKELKEIKESKEFGQPKEQKESASSGIPLKEAVNGTLAGGMVYIEEDFQRAQVLYDRSKFGELHGIKKQRLELSLVEALYLQERDKLKIRDSDGKLIKFDKLLDKAKKREKNFWTRYRVFRDLRTRGLLLKTALKFGADFRVYDRGAEPGKQHAHWVLYCADENQGYTWRQFSAMNRVAHSTKKKLLLGIVDDEGEVTYYEVRWKRP